MPDKESKDAMLDWFVANGGDAGYADRFRDNPKESLRARAESLLNGKMADPEWAARYLRGDPDVVDEFNAYTMGMAYGGKLENDAALESGKAAWEQQEAARIEAETAEANRITAEAAQVLVPSQ